MKVLYDFQTFAMQTFGGVSRYYYELINSGLNNSNVNSDLAIRYTNNAYLHNDITLKDKFKYRYPLSNEIFPNLKFRGKGKINHLLGNKGSDIYLDGKMLSIKKLESGDFDIFHPTYYDPYFLPYLNGKPYVLTVHDMTHEIYPEYFNSNERSRIQDKRLLIDKAFHIIAISENTKKDIVAFTKYPEDKISVIYHANSLGIDPINSSINLPSQYLFYVGHRWIYKNFLLLVEVFASLLKKYPNLYLVAAGAGDFSNEERDFFKMMGVEGNIIYCGGKDDEIRAGYKNARAFVYPSLYEGFGIPILEAMEIGCPVICSDNSCFPEIARDAALYFSPKDFESIYKSLDSILSDENIRNELIQKGFKQVKKYSVDRMVSETEQVYLKVIQSK